MNTPRFNFAAIVLAVALSASLAGCGGSASYHYTRSRCASQVATPTGPIAVEATADCSASISASTKDNIPTVTYSFGDKRQIVVEANRIFVDGELAHTIPPGTKKIAIDVKSGQLAIQADDQPLPIASAMNAEQEIQ